MADRIFTETAWGAVSPASGWQFSSGAFTAAGNADLFGYHSANGSLWVGQNTGAGFSFGHWGSVSPTAGWWFGVGDFTGGTGADIVGYHPSNGALWVGTNTGTSFTLQQWGTVQGAWKGIPDYFLDFPANFRTDLFAEHGVDGPRTVGHGVVLDGGGHGEGPRFLDAPHRHTEVLRLDHDEDPPR